MKSLKVSYYSGMVNIENEDISFAWISGMYQGGRAGVGLQVNSHLNKKKTMEMCRKIAEAICEFHGKTS